MESSLSFILLTLKVHDEKERGTNIHKRIDRHWLGMIKIPFSTLYLSSESRLDGIFPVEKPAVLLGYTNGKSIGNHKCIIFLHSGIWCNIILSLIFPLNILSESHYFAQSLQNKVYTWTLAEHSMFRGKPPYIYQLIIFFILLGEDDQTIDATEIDQTYLKFFITFVPLLQPPPMLSLKFDSTEDTKVLDTVDMWLFELEQKFPNRNYKATVIDLNGQSVFITRFVKPLKPPEELINGQPSGKACIEKVAHFVSLIPFVGMSSNI